MVVRPLSGLNTDLLFYTTVLLFYKRRGRRAHSETRKNDHDNFVSAASAHCHFVIAFEKPRLARPGWYRGSSRKFSFAACTCSCSGASTCTIKFRTTCHQLSTVPQQHAQAARLSDRRALGRGHQALPSAQSPCGAGVPPSSPTWISTAGSISGTVAGAATQRGLATSPTRRLQKCLSVTCIRNRDVAGRILCSFFLYLYHLIFLRGTNAIFAGLFVGGWCSFMHIAVRFPSFLLGLSGI